MNSLNDKPSFKPVSVFDFGRYINVLKKKWFSITLFAAVCTGIAAFVALNLTSKYVATATLKLEADTANAISIESVVGVDTSKQEYYLTEFEIIKSRAIAERVVETLQLSELAEFNPTLTPAPTKLGQLVERFTQYVPGLSSEQSEEKVQGFENLEYATQQKVLSRFSKGLSVVPVRRTHLVKISYESRDPALAAEIANAVGQAYIEEGLRARLDVEAQASSWISKRLSELRDQLALSESALNDFLASEQLIDNSGIDSQATAAINDLQLRLSQVTDKRIQLESEYGTLSNGNLSSSEAFATTEAISLHPQVIALNSSLTSADKDITELSKRYGPKHKKMIAAVAKRESIKQQLDGTIQQLVGGVGKALKTARAQEALLQKEMAEKVSSFQKLSVKKRQYDALVLEVETNRNILNLFLNRQKETSAAGGFRTQSARFTDKAVPPILPAKPNKKLIVVLAFLGSLTLIMSFVLLRDSLRNTIDSVKGCEERLGLIPLGAIPKVTSRRSKGGINSQLFFDKKFVGFSEAVRSIRTVISLMKRKNKLVVIASSLPNEGKTTTAVNLAIAYAQTERTVVIDADLRKSSVAERFGLNKFSKGVVNHVAMGEPLKDCLHRDETSGVMILPAGMLAHNPQDILSSDKFSSMIKMLEENFDRIVIDTPPTLTVSDSLIVGKLATSVLLVVKANSTRVNTFRNTISRFSTHDVQVDGLILNKVLTKVSKNEYQYLDYQDTAKTNA